MATSSGKAQQLLRQQVVFAKKHLQLAEASSDTIASYASIQACIVSLDLGLSQYIGSLFEVPTIVSLVSIMPEDLEVEAPSSNYKQEEICALFTASENWLVEFKHLVEEVKRVPVTKRSSTQNKPVDLIASSVSLNMPEWWETSVNALTFYTEAASELLERHTSFDQEY